MWDLWWTREKELGQFLFNYYSFFPVEVDDGPFTAAAQQEQSVTPPQE
jgi:hypothetical protein